MDQPAGEREKGVNLPLVSLGSFAETGKTPAGAPASPSEPLSFLPRLSPSPSSLASLSRLSFSISLYPFGTPTAKHDPWTPACKRRHERHEELQKESNSGNLAAFDMWKAVVVGDGGSWIDREEMTLIHRLWRVLMAILVSWSSTHPPRRNGAFGSGRK